MLKQRIITGVILASLVIFMLFVLPPVTFAWITAVILLYVAWEYTHLIGIGGYEKRMAYVFAMLVILFLNVLLPTKFFLYIGFLWWLLAIILLISYQRHQWKFSFLQEAIIGFLLLVPCWVAINALRFSDHGKVYLLFLMLIVWGSDISAYFAGKKWGKRKLASNISPHKSIEGVCGALVTTLILSILGSLVFQLPGAQWLSFVLLSMITASFSVIGDLFESVLKRMGSIKDSGNLLPGHGGLLDRIDSLTAAAPIFVLTGKVLGFL